MHDLIKRNIDIALLRTLIAVVESGGMTAASARLNLTQAAISQQVKRLEDLFGAELFSRDHRRLAVTAKGERLLAFARRMVALNDETFNAIVAPEFEGEIRLGVPFDIVGFFMPGILNRFRKTWPKARIQLCTKSTKFLLEMLDSDSLDIVLTTEAFPRDCVLLADRLVWTGKAGGTAWQERPLPVSVGEETCAFRASIIDALSKAGLDWKVITHAGSIESTYTLLQADMFVSPLLSHTIPQDVEVLTHDGHGLPNLPIFYINKIAREAPSPIVKELSSFIEQGFIDFQKNRAA